MAHEVITNFPTSVDERLFYNDINIEQLNILNHYKILLDASNYDGASNLLRTSDIDYAGAWLWNLFELRIKATQEYLLTKEKPQLQTYSSTTPTGISKGMVWIGGDI